MATSSLRNVPAPELRKWAPLLRRDAVKAGDVLLTRKRDVESFCIRVATWGPYSHAGIFLPFSGALELLEADDFEVGRGPFLRPLRVEIGGKALQVWRLPSEASAAALLRHPCMKKIDENTLARAALAFNDTELLRHYSSFDRLAGPLDYLPSPMRRALGRGLLAREQKRQGPVLPGSFCSELVAKFFERVDIRLFPRARKPEKVAPNHLTPRRSYLKIVPNALITAAGIPDDAAGWVVDVLQRETRSTYLRSLVDLRAKKELFFPKALEMIKNPEAASKQDEGHLVRHMVLRLLKGGPVSANAVSHYQITAASAQEDDHSKADVVEAASLKNEILIKYSGVQDLTAEIRFYQERWFRRTAGTEVEGLICDNLEKMNQVDLVTKASIHAVRALDPKDIVTQNEARHLLEKFQGRSQELTAKLTRTIDSLRRLENELNEKLGEE
jgi:hypothetical protein